jgi:hypothetical protein
MQAKSAVEAQSKVIFSLMRRLLRREDASTAEQKSTVPPLSADAPCNDRMHAEYNNSAFLFKPVVE